MWTIHVKTKDDSYETIDIPTTARLVAFLEVLEFQTEVAVVGLAHFKMTEAGHMSRVFSDGEVVHCSEEAVLPRASQPPLAKTPMTTELSRALPPSQPPLYAWPSKLPLGCVPKSPSEARSGVQRSEDTQDHNERQRGVSAFDCCAEEQRRDVRGYKRSTKPEKACQ